MSRIKLCGSFCLILLLFCTASAPGAAAGGYAVSDPVGPESRPDSSVMVRVAVFPQNPPYQFLDDTGAPAGINIDIMEVVAQKCNYYFIYSIYDSQSACLQAMNSGAADIVLGCNINYKDPAHYYTTSELSSATASVVARKSIVPYIQETQKINTFSIVYEYGSVDLSLLYSMGFKHMLCVSSQANALDGLLEQKADIFIGSNESANYILNQSDQSDSFETVYSMVSTIRYAVLVNKSSASVYRNLNRALEDIHANGIYEEIHNSWVTNPFEKQFEAILRCFFISLAVFVCFTLAFLGVSYVLKQKINEKTQQLILVNSSLENTIEDLQHEAAFRNSILDSIPIGAVLFNLDYHITLMNPAACALCGLKADLKDCMDIWNLPIFGEILERIDLDSFDDNRNGIFDLSVRGRDCKYRCWIHILKRNEMDHTGVLMLVEDITEEELHRQKLAAMEKAAMLNQVTAGIAHEIKNPLMTLKIGVSLLETQWEDTEVRQAFLEFIPAEIEKINTLVESLLNYAKPPREEFSVLKIAEVVKRSFYLASITNKGAKNDIALSTCIKADPHVRIQQDLFQQTLTNLLINAIWAVSAKLENPPPHWKGEITGTIQSDGRWVSIIVFDNGVGMSQDTLRHCMEPFFTTKAAGTGLGLALARQCVENNGGRMLVDSREGEYTDITIQIPCHNPVDHGP